MAVLSISLRPPVSASERGLARAAAALALVILFAMARQLALHAALPWPRHTNPWLMLHVVTVVPALPLGGWLLFGRKGTTAHRVLGRIWAGLMMTAALSSFGLTERGYLTPTHLLSVLMLVGVPRGVWLAMRGRAGEHRQTMLRV